MGITIKDIAKKAGVSYATVSRALNDHPDVNINTKKDIINLAKKMNYRPNAIARSLINKKTNTIGLLIPDITNPFFPKVARGVEETAAKQNYNVFLCNNNWNVEREEHYLNVLVQKQVDGLIVLPSSDDPAHLQKILDTGLPIVLISTLIENKNITSVLTNNFDGAKTAVNYLIKKGHKKIAFIGGGGNKYTDTERLNGYKTALKNNNRKVDETYIINNRGYTRENGYKSMKELFKNKTAPDAIFAHNDLIALGAIQAIKEEKLLIPQDISIIGFDDIFFASLPEIQLSTIAQQKYRMGQVASEALIEQISSKSNKLTSEKIMIDYSFKIRNTCR